MTGIPDELVEKAAEAVYNLTRMAGSYDRWAIALPSMQESYRTDARAALEAVGLPALLERVEAAEGVNPILADAMHYYAERRSMNNPKGWEHVLRIVARGVERVWPTSTEEQRRQAIDVINSLVVAEQADCDALAAKVADAWDEGKAAAIDGYLGDGEPVNPYRAALTEGEKP